jgi:hypothetical protein
MDYVKLIGFFETKSDQVSLALKSGTSISAIIKKAPFRQNPTIIVTITTEDDGKLRYPGPGVDSLEYTTRYLMD